MKGLFFADPMLPRLRQDLLAAAPREAAALLLAGRAEGPHGTRLLVRESFPVPPSAYRAQEPMRAVIDPLFIMPLLKRARQEGASLILAHTHPFAEVAQFSAADDEGEGILMPTFLARTGGSPHAALVLTASDCRARIWPLPLPKPPPPVPVFEVGRELRRHGDRAADHPPIAERFDRACGPLAPKARPAWPPWLSALWAWVESARLSPSNWPTSGWGRSASWIPIALRKRT